jgi:hypothetical protein
MTKALKIPKKVAGVKLPKKVRKRAKKALKMGASPVVREIAAAAIGAATAKAAGSGSGSNGGGRAKARIHFDGGEIGEAFRSAAVAGLQRFLEGFEEGLRGLKDADEGGKKPSRRSARP